MKYTKEILESAAKESRSVREVMRRVGANPSSSSLATHLAKQLKRFEIDTSHFTGQGHWRGKKGWNRRTADQVLVRLGSDSAREKSYVLRRALLDTGREYRCAKCGISEWNGRSLGLDVAHKDNDRLNNQLENLDFLCPNCHRVS